MKRLYAFLLFLSLASTANAWWSFEDLGFPQSSHRKISEQAISLINTSAYPDLKKERFGQTIIDATYGGGNDANAHGKLTDPEVGYTGRNDADKFDGGDFGPWWDYSQFKYKKMNFTGSGYAAYYYIGLMAHLVQDQAVPAHAANIYHASAFWKIPLNPDNLEQWADLRMFPSADYVVGPNTDPLDYYYQQISPTTAIGILPETQAKLSSSTWRSPISDRSYWYANPYAQYAYTGQALWGDLSKAKIGNFMGSWGI